MQGFEKENCILQKNKLIENDRQFALIPIPKQRTSYSTPWLPKKHFKQLVNQPTLAKISLKLLATNPLILKIDKFKRKKMKTQNMEKNTFRASLENQGPRDHTCFIELEKLHRSHRSRRLYDQMAPKLNQFFFPGKP